MMAIGTVKVEMNDGIVYEGEVELLSYAPLVCWAGSSWREHYNLNLVLSHCDIIDQRNHKPKLKRS